MGVLGLDHVDLTVTDLDRAIEFYQTVLDAPARITPPFQKID